MRSALACVLLVLFAAHAGAEEDTAPAPDLDAELARLVDLPTSAARRAAADALAARADVDVDAWLAAMRGFGAFAAAPAGLGQHDVPLVRTDGTRASAATSVYVPARYDPRRPAPLLVALHGAGGRGEDVVPMWRATADLLGMLILAPTEAAETGGFAFSVQEREDVLQVLRWARRRFNVDEDRIHLTGVSRGGHLAWDLAVRHPGLWASVAPMIGGPRLQIVEGQNNLRYVENVAPLPLRDLQGRDDDPRLIANLRMAFERLQEAGAPDAKLLLQDGYAHGFDLAAVDWVVFFGKARRVPRPARVLRLAARPGEGRSRWAEILETSAKVEEVFSPQVSAVRWRRMDEDARRRALQAMVDDRTARLEVERKARGRYVAHLDGVRRFRVLLASEDLPEEGPVEVVGKGHRVRCAVASSKEVLLGEFAERFDRTFLPVMEVVVP